MLPVWLLLQPRDFINSHQLFVGLGAIFTAIFVANPELTEPFGALGFSEIATAHRRSGRQGDLGEPAHADPADAHEVKVAPRHSPPPMAITRSAMRRAAFG